MLFLPKRLFGSLNDFTGQIVQKHMRKRAEKLSSYLVVFSTLSTPPFSLTPQNLPHLSSQNGTLFLDYCTKTLPPHFSPQLFKNTMSNKVLSSRNDNLSFPIFTKLCDASPNNLPPITLSALTNIINSMSFRPYFKSYF